MKITTKSVSSENFKKYGSVVKKSSESPTSQALDYKFWSNITSYKIDGATEIGICTVFKQPINIIEGLERHLNTPEILIPIDTAFVLPLLADDENESIIESFQVNIGEVVVINPGVWHGACIPVGKSESSYFVIFKKDTSEKDVEKKNIIRTEIEF